MHNAFKILKINKAYRSGVINKWQKMVAIVCVAIMIISFIIASVIRVIKHTGGLDTSFTSIMTVNCFLLSAYAMEGFVPQKIMEGNKRKMRDLRNQYIFMPFRFSDFILAGLISLIKNFLLSNLLFVYFVSFACISNADVDIKGWVGFTLLINTIVYLLVGVSYLSSYIKNKFLNTIMPKFFAASIAIWIIGLFTYGIFFIKSIKMTVFSPLCSVSGMLLSLSIIPVLFILTMLMINKNKERAWFNE